MDITCFSISSNDMLDKVYILLNSILHNKKKRTNIDYYLLLDMTKQHDLQYCLNYFKPLATSNFHIKIVDMNMIKILVDRSLGKPFYFLKAFAPKLFGEDKILYLDTDMVFIKPGIQDLWKTNINKYYVAAVEQPLVTYLMFQQLRNTQTTRETKYFNAGMMLMNLKKLREDGMDKKLLSMVVNWDRTIVQPDSPDQSLFNYYFKGKVKYLDFKYNNTILVSTNKTVKPFQQFLKDKYGLDDIRDSLNNAVIYHFLGQNKPWVKEVREEQVYEKDFPFKKQCINIWDILEKAYRRPVNNMHIVFITRCYKPTNIQKIKDNLKEVFSKQTNFTYQQYLVVDMTHGGTEDQFNFFKDDLTHVQFAYEKIDQYNCNYIDLLVDKINKENTFVYILDDDNLIKKEFLNIFNNYNNEDMIIFHNDGHNCYKDGIIRVGGIDMCNFITKLQTMKQIKFYDGEDSYSCDGRFAVKVLKSQKKILYLKDSCVIYGALSKP